MRFNATVILCWITRCDCCLTVSYIGVVWACVCVCVGGGGGACVCACVCVRVC